VTKYQQTFPFICSEDPATVRQATVRQTSVRQATVRQATARQVKGRDRHVFHTHSGVDIYRWLMSHRYIVCHLKDSG